MKYRVNVDVGFEHQGKLIRCGDKFETDLDLSKEVERGFLIEVPEPDKKSKKKGE